MYFRPLRLVRRALALTGLLATLSGVVAPVCAEVPMKQVSGEHCGDPRGQDAPMPGMPDGPSGHHHLPAVCTMGTCVATPLAPAVPAVTHLPAVSAVPALAFALATEVPEHPTPPPRS